MYRIVLTVVLLLATLGSFGAYFYLDRLIIIGQQKITVGEKQIADGEERIRAGEVKLRSGKQQLAVGKKRLAQGKKKYRAMKSIPYGQIGKLAPEIKPILGRVEYEVAEGGRKIAAGEKKVAWGERQIAIGEKKLADGKKRLNAGKIALEKGKKQLSKAKAVRQLLGWLSIVFGVLTIGAIILCVFSKKRGHKS